MARFVFHIAIRTRYNYGGYKRTKKVLLPYEGHLPYSATQFVNFVLAEYSKMVQLKYDITKRVFVKNWTGSRLLECEKELFEALVAKYAEIKKAKREKELQELKKKKKAAKERRDARLAKSRLGKKNAENTNNQLDEDGEQFDDEYRQQFDDEYRQQFDDEDRQQFDEENEQFDGEYDEEAQQSDNEAKSKKKKKGGKTARSNAESPTAQLYIEKRKEVARVPSEPPTSPSSSDERCQPTPPHPGAVRKSNQNIPTPTSSEKERRKVAARRLMYSPVAHRQGLIHDNLAEELEQDLPKSSLLDGFDLDDIFPN